MPRNIHSTGVPNGFSIASAKLQTLLYVINGIRATNAGKEMTYKRAYYLIDEINEHSDFGEYELASVIPEQDRYQIDTEGIRPPSFYLENQIKGFYHLFDGDYRLMVIITYSKNMNIFGVRTGDSVEILDEKLNPHNYYRVELNDVKSETEYIMYMKEDTGILIFEKSKEYNAILAIQVSIDYPKTQPPGGAY